MGTKSGVSGPSVAWSPAQNSGNCTRISTTFLTDLKKGKNQNSYINDH